MYEHPENINIYLKNANAKKKILGNDTGSYERYIILMNDTLQSQNQENIKNIQIMETRIEELDEELLNLERKNEYIKSLLKNFHEMSKSWKNIGENRLTIIQNTRNTFLINKQISVKNIRYLETIMTFFIAFLCKFYSLSYAINVAIMFFGIAFYKNIYL
jgi:site-specific recombinase XerD